MVEMRKFHMVLVPLVAALLFAILLLMGGFFPAGNGGPSNGDEGPVPEQTLGGGPIVVNMSAAPMPYEENEENEDQEGLSVGGGAFGGQAGSKPLATNDPGSGEEIIAQQTTTTVAETTTSVAETTTAASDNTNPVPVPEFPTIVAPVFALLGLVAVILVIKTQ